MRLIVQRVACASVLIDNAIYCSIGQGFLCFVGFSINDTKDDFEWVINKLLKLKLFSTNLSLQDIDGELLIISQFTLFASIKKGNKPSWSKAAKTDLANKMYNQFITLCKLKINQKIKTGVFGSDMQIKSTNNGPLTLIIDTNNKE